MLNGNLLASPNKCGRDKDEIINAFNIVRVNIMLITLGALQANQIKLRGRTFWVQCAGLNVFFSSVTSETFLHAAMFTDHFHHFTISKQPHIYFFLLFYFLLFPQWLLLLFLSNHFPSSSPSPGPLPGCFGGEHQRKLYRDLMENYNRLERPVQNDSAPIVVELGLTLLQIIDVVSVYMDGNMHGNSVECHINSNVPPIFFFFALFTVCILFPSDLFSNQEEHSLVYALHCTSWPEAIKIKNK